MDSSAAPAGGSVATAAWAFTAGALFGSLGQWLLQPLGVQDGLWLLRARGGSGEAYYDALLHRALHTILGHVFS